MIEQLTSFANYVDDSALVGSHTIRITAHNAEGSDQLLVHWTVHEPGTLPTISLNVPETMSNLQGEVRIILAHVNTPCTIQWFINGVCVAEMRGDPLTLGYFGYNTSKLSVGQHTLTVTAGNQHGSDSKTIVWTISGPYDIVCQVHGEDCDMDVGGILKINATLNERRDGSQFVEVAYNTIIGMDILRDQQTGDKILGGGDLDIECTVGWPLLTLPDEVVEYPHQTQRHSTPSGIGSMIIEVEPDSRYYSVHVKVNGECSFTQWIELPPLVLPGKAKYEYDCGVRLSF